MSFSALLGEWRALPPSVALFRRRARRLAESRDDEFTLRSVTRADELGRLIDLARGRRHVVELGTGTAWTAIALALAERERRVVSYDPLYWDGRNEYLQLAGAARERITLVEAPGANGPQPDAPPAELLFIDSSHDREPTLAEFAAWRDALGPGAIVAFHDYDEPAYPGVAEAVRELGLEGEVFGHLFIWRAP
ncbi:MAG TPA: class I SAM-dependent methyltransferase [Thermoleophilaceae bacterium]